MTTFTMANVGHRLLRPGSVRGCRPETGQDCGCADGSVVINQVERCVAVFTRD
jgi:hypothetical protein